VTPFDGDLEEYRRRVLSDRDGNSSSRSERSAKPVRNSDDRRNASAKRAEAKQLRDRVANAEAEVGRLTRELERLDAALADGGLFARDPAQAAALAKARASHAAALVRAEEDWLAAGTDLQSAMG
jgi:ATP-binding cassette subfamily F protein 3